VLDAVTKCLEADTSIVDIVLNNLVLVEPAAIAVMEFLRQVPVIEGLGK
jgi:hypothetical protein